MEELVHIVPLGWERVRVVEAIRDAKAHRVYLLSRDDDHLNAKFQAAVRRDLKGIVDSRNIVDVHIRADQEFNDVVFHVARLIRHTRGAGGRPYVHAATSSKTAAIAAALCASYHADEVAALYYAGSSQYLIQGGEGSEEALLRAGLSLDYTGLRSLPTLKIRRPRQASLLTLAFLFRKPLANLRELVANLVKLKEPPFDAHPDADPRQKESGGDLSEINWDARFRRLVLKELLEDSLVEALPGEKRALRYRLTEHGRFHALLSGFLAETDVIQTVGDDD